MTIVKENSAIIIERRNERKYENEAEEIETC